jgi:hypothetical protein
MSFLQLTRRKVPAKGTLTSAPLAVIMLLAVTMTFTNQVDAASNASIQASLYSNHAVNHVP